MTIAAMQASLDDYNGHYSACLDGHRQARSATLRDSENATLDEIEDAARRLVALRNWGVTEGARRIGITHGALSRWAHRRKIST